LEPVNTVLAALKAPVNDAAAYTFNEPVSPAVVAVVDPPALGFDEDPEEHAVSRRAAATTETARRSLR